MKRRAPFSPEKEMEKILAQLSIARNRFDNTTDPQMIDSSIYKMQAAEFEFKTQVSTFFATNPDSRVLRRRIIPYPDFLG